MRKMRWSHNAIICNTDGIEHLTKSIDMDYLTSLISHITLSANTFYNGELCQLVSLEETAGHLHILRSGKLVLTVSNGKSQIIDRPSILFFPRPCSHTIEPENGKSCELLCAYIDLGKNVRSPLALSLPEVILITLDEMSSLSPTLDLLINEAFGESFGRKAALDRLVEYFLIQILRHVEAKGYLKGGIFAALADPRLKNAASAMHEFPGHLWTLDELADLAGMSRARFAVNFRELVGITPLDYLTDWRVSVAQNMLKNGRPIKSVAAAVGYQSHAALSRVFTKRIGLPPTEWLKEIQK
jgi:AraC-like DNA-binding protein